MSIDHSDPLSDPLLDPLSPDRPVDVSPVGAASLPLVWPVCFATLVDAFACLTLAFALWMLPESPHTYPICLAGFILSAAALLTNYALSLTRGGPGARVGAGALTLLLALGAWGCVAGAIMEFVQLAGREPGHVELEGWNVFSLLALLMALFAWTGGVRLLLSWSLLVHSPAQSLEEPRLRWTKGALDVMRCLVNALCVGALFKDCVKKSSHMEHICHHIYQLIYEFIVLSVSVVVLGESFELFGVLMGLAGSLFGLIHLYRADVMFNGLAALCALVSVPVTASKHEMGLGGLSAIFTVYALFIRLKSLLHSLIESKEWEHEWALQETRRIEKQQAETGRTARPPLIIERWAATALPALAGFARSLGPRLWARKLQVLGLLFCFAPLLIAGYIVKEFLALSDDNVGLMKQFQAVFPPVDRLAECSCRPANMSFYVKPVDEFYQGLLCDEKREYHSNVLLTNDDVFTHMLGIYQTFGGDEERHPNVESSDWLPRQPQPCLIPRDEKLLLHNLSSLNAFGRVHLPHLVVSGGQLIEQANFALAWHAWLYPFLIGLSVTMAVCGGCCCCIDDFLKTSRKKKKKSSVKAAATSTENKQAAIATNESTTNL